MLIWWYLQRALCHHWPEACQTLAITAPVSNRALLQIQYKYYTNTNQYNTNTTQVQYRCDHSWPPVSIAPQHHISELKFEVGDCSSSLHGSDHNVLQFSWPVNNLLNIRTPLLCSILHCCNARVVKVLHCYTTTVVYCYISSCYIALFILLISL